MHAAVRGGVDIPLADHVEALWETTRDLHLWLVDVVARLGHELQALDYEETMQGAQVALAFHFLAPLYDRLKDDGEA